MAVSWIFANFTLYFKIFEEMNKTQIVSALAEKVGISKVDAANYINTIFGVIADNIVEGDGLVAIFLLCR